MKKYYFPVYILIISLISFGCGGVKNMSGTLSKSDEKRSAETSRHGDYLGTSASYRSDSLNNERSGASQPAEVNSGRAWESKNSDVYRKDYGRINDGRSDNTGSLNAAGGSSLQDYNQKLINQYAEMDKLGDVLLYELEISDRRNAQLLEQYRNASSRERESISRELDQLNADQLTLYKSYTNIYKNGKTDWPRVKNEVETVLMNLREVDKKR